MATKICKKSVSDRNKKYLIVALLLGACTASIFLLLSVSDSATKTLNHIAQADSLIRRDLNIFNISGSQIRDRTIEVTDTYSRKVYDVRVPPGFSKTHLHQELHETFYGYGISAPAHVVFPDKDFHIQLVDNSTVFATIRVSTDPELSIMRSFGSILVAFDEKPPEKILQRVEALGEVIPIVLKIDDIDQTSEFSDDFQNELNNILIWLQGEDEENVIDMDSENSRSRAAQFSKSSGK